MEIIISKLFRPRKCEYGDFELVPESGWKLSQIFKDYESKLLVVSVSCEDKSKWTDNGYNGWAIPTKEFKINLDTLRILEFNEWKEYFNYEKIEFISEDQKYKLITQRVYEPKRNSDGIKEELYDIELNKLISSSESIAFNSEKRDNILENLYRSIKEREEQKRILEAKPNLTEFYLKELDNLKEADIVIGYIDNSNTYKLAFELNQFILSKSDKVPTDYGDWKTMDFYTIQKYSTLDDFWEDFTKDNQWFLKNRMHQTLSEKPLTLTKHIISYFNKLREKHNFTFKEYDNINEWQNSVWSEEYKRTELKQWCSACYKEVNYQGRYPKYICSDCATKDILDNEGNFLDFSNLGLSGGFNIIRKNKDGQIVEEDSTKEFCDCIIDGKVYIAQEARFGGIVIQLKE